MIASAFGVRHADRGRELHAADRRKFAEPASSSSRRRRRCARRARRPRRRSGSGAKPTTKVSPRRVGAVGVQQDGAARSRPARRRREAGLAAARHPGAAIDSARYRWQPEQHLGDLGGARRDAGRHADRRCGGRAAVDRALAGNQDREPAAVARDRVGDARTATAPRGGTTTASRPAPPATRAGARAPSRRCATRRPSTCSLPVPLSAAQLGARRAAIACRGPAGEASTRPAPRAGPARAAALQPGERRQEAEPARGREPRACTSGGAGGGPPRDLTGATRPTCRPAPSPGPWFRAARAACRPRTCAAHRGRAAARRSRPTLRVGIARCSAIVGSSPRQLDRALQMLDGLRVVAALVVHPAEAVDVEAVVRIDREGAADERLRLVEVGCPVGVGVAEVVERGGVLRVQLDRAAHLLERRLPSPGLVVQRAEREVVVVVVRVALDQLRANAIAAGSCLPRGRATPGSRSARSCPARASAPASRARDAARWPSLLARYPIWARVGVVLGGRRDGESPSTARRSRRSRCKPTPGSSARGRCPGRRRAPG